MLKKTFAVLAVLASLVWMVDIALIISQDTVGLPVIMKIFLIVCFLYYAYRVFFLKKTEKPPAK
ncbi:MAG: hypothetical protein QNJ97_24380 [Myxococcota bacterium]|nr:hypothetical protein [Myxococcota bacterium]